MGTWTATGARSRRVVQLASGVGETPAADPLSTLIGVPLANVESVAPTLRAPAGQTFTGVGTLEGWTWNPKLSLWVRSPRSDDDVADFAGLELASFPGKPVTSSAGYWLWRPVGVTFSGGTDLTTEYVCTARGERGELL